jgi:thioredoxin-like negative regulator of GroEL
MIGDWLNDDTPVEQVAAFAKKTFGKQDFSGFTGDPRFIQNAYSHKTFSKLRDSIAGLYAWRLKQATNASEKERMARAADFAFRQAWALCPYSPEAVFRYINFLLAQDRIADALVVAETAAQMQAMQGKEGDQIRALVEQVKKFQKAKQTSSGGK